ncbi:MAG: cell division protein FtsW [Saprospiraceae bacterium]|jgi:cell division protein FtsW|nr:cell division protein FtsW [Saprospiraceae bacterium]MBK6477138.1 cell division protein FtsW [Saprospiraceae bacterium]MBK6814562.1 cell division protein FtsW [Saprospiraceae bacterium]MBK7437652.1 cell division protein FtsW [Saprospiraceae bacterium]MBK7608775.1 cell division protein FtsW [Saprospiraceae bacterium]
MLQIATKKEWKGDKVMWLIIGILLGFGLLAVYSATGSMAYLRYKGNTEMYLIKQLIMVGIGLLCMYACHRQNYLIYNKLAPVLFLIAIPLLIYTLAFGVETNDAKRWITLPVINLSFQTSDYARLALIIYLARSLSNKQEYIKDFKSAFIPIMVPILIICGLIAPSNLSTSLLLFVTSIMLMFVGRVSFKYIFMMGFFGALLFGVVVLVWWFFPDLARVDTWISRIKDFTGSDGGYQVVQSKIAIANGSWMGVGPGNSTQRNFLPAAYADYIYAIICEEYGLIGATGIVILYLWLLFRVSRIVLKSPKAFGAMLAMGLILNLVVQAFANMAVSVNLVPVTGLTLPLVSMGGTSVLFTSVAFGIIMSVSKFIESMQEEQPVPEKELIPITKKDSVIKKYEEDESDH